MSENGNGNGAWRVRPAHVGTGAVSFFGGILTHRLAGNKDAFPIETADWILKGGATAILLVGVALFVWLYWDERRAHQKTREQLTTKVESLMRESHQEFTRDALGKIETFMRDAHAPLRPVLVKLTKVLAVASEVIRGKAILESDLRSLDDTPEDGHPLPPPARKS